jgi:hypothetical protein
VFQSCGLSSMAAKQVLIQYAKAYCHISWQLQHCLSNSLLNLLLKSSRSFAEVLSRLRLPFCCGGCAGHQRY